MASRSKGSVTNEPDVRHLIGVLVRNARPCPRCHDKMRNSVTGKSSLEIKGWGVWKIVPCPDCNDGLVPDYTQEAP